VTVGGILPNTVAVVSVLNDFFCAKIPGMHSVGYHVNDDPVRIVNNWLACADFEAGLQKQQEQPHA
jgi:hypothetical protein